ncbi:hypothetical protein V2G26_009729 [Clonostachys chloroleuca]
MAYIGSLGQDTFIVSVILTPGRVRTYREECTGIELAQKRNGFLWIRIRNQSTVDASFQNLDAPIIQYLTTTKPTTTAWAQQPWQRNAYSWLLLKGPRLRPLLHATDAVSVNPGATGSDPNALTVRMLPSSANIARHLHILK